MGYIEEYKELGTGRNFSRRKSLDADELVMNIKQESQFLRWQTSTVSGEKKRREKIASGLFKNEKLGFRNLAENENNFKKKFLEFLDNDVWDEFKKRVHSDTNLTMTEAGEAIAGGASVQDLEEAFKKYQSGETETDIWEIWDNWTSPANKGG